MNTIRLSPRWCQGGKAGYLTDEILISRGLKRVGSAPVQEIGIELHLLFLILLHTPVEHNLGLEEGFQQCSRAVVAERTIIIFRAVLEASCYFTQPKSYREIRGHVVNGIYTNHRAHHSKFLEYLLACLVLK